MRKTAKEAVRQRKIYMVLIIILIIVLSVLGGDLSASYKVPF